MICNDEVVILYLGFIFFYFWEMYGVGDDHTYSGKLLASRGCLLLKHWWVSRKNL